jgi:hypothetical protein
MFIILRQIFKININCSVLLSKINVYRKYKSVLIFNILDL